METWTKSTQINLKNHLRINFQDEIEEIWEPEEV